MPGRSLGGQAFFLLKVAGIGATRASTAAEALIAEGATALLSWGSAGALHPDLSPGDLILPRTVFDPHGTNIPTDAAWHDRLSRKLEGTLAIHAEPLIQSSKVLASAAEKINFYEQFSAVAVDMESASVARAASEAGFPFMAIRAIADTSDMAIPQSVLMVVDKHGGLRPFHLLGSFSRRPADLLLLNRLRRNFAAARSTLNKVAQLAGEDLLAFA